MNELKTMNNPLSDEVLNNLSTLTKWDIKKRGNEVVAKTVVAVIHEQGRACLTNTALENIGALSALEEHLSNMAPSGSERYKAIVDAYTLGSAKKIGRR